MSSIPGENQAQSSKEVKPLRYSSVALELSVLHIRYLIARLLLLPFPAYFGGRIRRRVLCWSGFDIGKGTVFWGTPDIVGQGKIYPRLKMGINCWINKGCLFDLSDSITFGNAVSVGHDVLFLTSSHKLGSALRRAGDLYTSSIRIGDGAWIGARCTILPGVTIGSGAVVGAGALVNEDVAPNTLVGGVPAQIIRMLN
jgi:maltose O-acetyltransferase